MFEQILKTLEPEVLINQLWQEEGCQEAQEAFVRDMQGSSQESMIVKEHQIHLFYCILILTSDEDQIFEIINLCQLFPKLNAFLSSEVGRCMGRQTSMLVFEEIVEICKLALINTKLHDDDFEDILSIITMIYDYTKLTFHQDSTSTLNNLFLECFGIINKKGNYVSEAIYAELLVKSPDNLDNFFDFFQEYFKKDPMEQEFRIISCLFKSLAKRLPLLMKEFSKRRNYIVNKVYESIASFLSKQPKSSYWLNYLQGEEEPIIIESLLQICSKNMMHFQLAKILDNIIFTFLDSDLSGPAKYHFIVKIYKRILNTSALLFPIMSTEPLSDDPTFLTWFMATEIKVERYQEIIDVYMTNKYSLEFLLAILNYYLYHFPEHKDHVKYLTTSINLMEESMCFMSSENVRSLLRAYHEHIEEEESYQEIENRVLDAATAFEM